MSGCVSSASSHVRSSCNCRERKSLARGSGQVRMCKRSSSGASQMGQLECRRCFRSFIFLPEGMSALIHLEINFFITNRVDLRALPYADQLTRSSKRKGSKPKRSASLSTKL